MQTRIGRGEGRLNLLIWDGYAEDGGTRPAVDWVTPFEQETGCRVHVRVAAGSDQMVRLAEADGGRDWDGVSASGDVAGRLIAARMAAPLDVGLFANDGQLWPALDGPSHTDVNGVHFGIPWMWSTDALLYDTAAVSSPPTSWARVYDGSFTGHVTGYGNPISIAAAALYLKNHDPSLGISDPYELTDTQLDEASGLLERQHADVSRYWSVPSGEAELFRSGAAEIGLAWPYAQSVLDREGASVASVIPREGTTGHVDSWMMLRHAPHPNCMLHWLSYTLSPAVQAQAAAWTGAAPANPQACTVAPLTPSECSNRHEGDSAYLKRIAFATVPVRNCGNGRSDCAPYTEWQQRWQAITGS